MVHLQEETKHLYRFTWKFFYILVSSTLVTWNWDPKHHGGAGSGGLTPPQIPFLATTHFRLCFIFSERKVLQIQKSWVCGEGALDPCTHDLFFGSHLWHQSRPVVALWARAVAGKPWGGGVQRRIGTAGPRESEVVTRGSRRLRPKKSPKEANRTIRTKVFSQQSYKQETMKREDQIFLKKQFTD